MEIKVPEVTDGLPLDLQHPGGLVETVMDYIGATAKCPQPQFALGASLVFCGLLFGRRFADESGQRTNLFAMCIGLSSAGKDHSIKALVRLLDFGEATNLFISQITSDSAAEHALKHQPRLLFLLDEAGHFFAAVNDQGGGALRSVKPSLLQLWSSADTVWKGKQRAPQRDKEEFPVEIRNPHVCLLGMTQPQTFFEGASTKDIEDGWLARPIYFISKSRPKARLTIPDIPVPEAVFDAIRSYRDEPDPVVAKVVPTTPEAMEVLMKFQDETYEKMCEGDRGANDISYLYGKAAENARRVALTIAVGRDDRNPVIERRDMEYAVAVMRYTIGCSVAEIEDSVAENEYERYKKRILAVVRKFGAGGICRQELTRKTQFVDRLKRNEIIEDLLEARQIKQEASASGGDVFKYIG